MAYDPDVSQPAMMTQRVGAGTTAAVGVGSSSTAGSAHGAAIFAYVSADDAATVNGADYITDGQELGMQLGDIVEVIDVTTPLNTRSWVSALNANGLAVSLTAYV